MASYLGAPRILQSLAGGRVFAVLTFFANGYGAGNNPRRAVILSAVIALATILAGSLNVVAAIVSMFFLVSYGLLNYATFFEARDALEQAKRRAGKAAKDAQVAPEKVESTAEFGAEADPGPEKDTE